MADSITLPSVHGGHCSIDNHVPPWSGFVPDRATTDPFRGKICANCAGHTWCYNIQRPPNHDERVAHLVAIYSCYQATAKARNVAPFCNIVHAPFLQPFETWLEERYGVSYREAQVQMPEGDFIDFLSGSAELEYRAVEFEIMPRKFRAEHEAFWERIAREHPAIVRVGSLHLLEAGGEIVRLSNQHGERPRAEALFNQLGREGFWLGVLGMTLDAVERLPIQVLGHPFGWQKRMPADCPDTQSTRAVLRQIARAMATRGMLVDLNTSGFLKGKCNDNPYFPAEWVPLFLEQGVRFTVGDDSHNQSEVGQAFDKLLEFCQRTGITEVYQPVFAGQANEMEWTSVDLGQ